MGENGLFRKAQQAREEYLNAKNYEETEVAKAVNEIEEYVNGNRDLYEDGYKAGKNSCKMIRKLIDTYNYVGTNVSATNTVIYDIKDIIPEYSKLTVDNFAINCKHIFASSNSSKTNINDSGVDFTITSYENGILTISLPGHSRVNNGITSCIDLEIIAFYIE